METPTSTPIPSYPEFQQDIEIARLVASHGLQEDEFITLNLIVQELNEVLGSIPPDKFEALRALLSSDYAQSYLGNTPERGANLDYNLGFLEILMLANTYLTDPALRPPQPQEPDENEAVTPSSVIPNSMMPGGNVATHFA